VSDGNGSPAVRVVLGVLAVLGTLAGWALASAPGSAPDDAYHLSSIWCAQGVSEDRCREVPGDEEAREVPAGVSGYVSCFAGDPAKSAACQAGAVRSPAPSVVTNAGNWNRAYPPLFYWLNSWFVSDHLAVSAVAMRMFSGLVGVGLVACLVALVPRRLRPAAALPLLLCSVPLGLSLIGSTNPSGWAVVAPFVLLLALHASYATSGRRRTLLCGLAVVAAVVGSGARADACLFTAMSVGLALILNWGRLRESWAPLVAAAVSVGVAAAFFLGAGQASALSDGLGADGVLGPTAQMGWFELAVFNAGQLPTLWTGALAVGPMGTAGWLDTAFPPIVGFLSLGALVVVLTLTWRRPRGVHAVALLLTVAAMFAYPLYILGRTSLTVGQGVQPRYLLPLVVVLVALVLLAGDGRLTRTQVWSVAGALTVAHAVALHVQVRRYVTGLDVSDVDLSHGSEWWWGWSLGPTTVWLVASAAFAVLAALVLQVGVPRPHPAGSDDGSDDGPDRSSSTVPKSPAAGGSTTGMA
jgi:hypothetical protein